MLRRKRPQAGRPQSSKRRKKIHRKPDPRIRVKPSAEIESRVAAEVRAAAKIAASLSEQNLFASGYLVSAVYYHDGLLSNFNANQPDADPADRIVAQVAAGLPAGFKRDYLQCLQSLCAVAFSELASGRFVAPVPYEPLSKSRNVHPYAIDLFTAEGTPVVAAARGIVVLAESEWIEGNWFSTSSVRGGNSVIAFNPDSARFFRYAHLESVQTRAGSFLEAGETIGRVGHTGFNAARSGHGRHLHFEINEYDGRTGRVVAVSHDDLESLLEAAVSGAFLRSVESGGPQTGPG